MGTDLYSLWQGAVAWLAGLGAVALCAVTLWLSPLGRVAREAWAKAWARYRQLGAVSQIVLAVCFIGISHYGATKGFWGRVPHDGGDTSLTVTGIYTGVTNIVDATVSPPLTNQLHLVRVEWLGNGGTADTPVSIRASETNEWTELTKIDPVVSIEGLTNVLVFVAETNYAHFAYWWFGTDRPAIIVIEEGIEIRAFTVTAHEVYLEWVCGETEATEYVIYKKTREDADWVVVAHVPAVVGGINRWTGRMFTVDRDTDWKIVTEITEGGN